MNLPDTELKVNENFLIQRCSFKNQPLQKERKLHRQIYESLLHQWLMKITDDQDLITYSNFPHHQHCSYETSKRILGK